MEANMDKFIMVDFYMQDCYWCQQFQADWNQLVDDFSSWYGDQVLFAKVNGPNNYYLTMTYKV